MNPDPAYYSLTTLLEACSLFILGSFVGWCVRRSEGKRSREADARQAETQSAPESAAACANRDPPSELARRTAEQAALHEWDGGDPRPNFCRQTRLSNGLR